MMRFDAPAGAWLAALVTGALFALSLDVGPVGPLILIAPVPVLVVALRSQHTGLIALVAFAARTLGASGVVLAYAGQIPIAILIPAIVPYALAFTLSVLSVRYAARRAPLWMALLAFPATAAAFEFLLGQVSPNGSFGAIGYSLIDVLPIAQLASLGGVTMVSFVASLVAMGIAWLIAMRGQWRAVAWIVGVPCVATVVFGVWRLSQPYDAEARVALGAMDALTMRAVRDEKSALEVAAAYADLVRRLAHTAPAPQFIVLPEKVFAERTQWASGSLAVLQQVVDQTGVTVVAGFDEDLDAHRRGNTARVLAPQTSAMTYLKRRMVPGLENEFTPGQQSLIDEHRGFAVCKDMDFPAMIRDYGQRGTTLMLVPAWDFIKDARMHSRMAVMRGIENGFAIARAAAMGRLTVSDGFGRIVAERTTVADEATTLTATVGLASLRTFYATHGDVFGWLTVAVSLLILSMAFVLRRSNAPHAAPPG